MGGGLWLGFKSVQEKSRAEKYLEPLDGSLGFSGTVLGRNVDWGVWFEEVWRTKSAIAIEYQMHYMSSSLSAIVAREIARRFDVRRVGSDSVGWYSNKAWSLKDQASAHPMSAVTRYGPHKNWVEWMKAYKLEWCPYVEMLSDELPVFKELERMIVEEFKRLDSLARGDS